MQVKFNDEKYLEIQQMKDLVSIDFQDLCLTSNHKTRIIPGFLVFYGQGKQLFLTSQDPYFEEFVKRLREVYLEEKDNVIREGFMGDEHIKISPFTEELLLYGNLDQVADWYQDYEKIEGYPESLLFEEDFVKSFFPIVEYHLRETLKMWNISIDSIRLSEGRNGIYYLSVDIDHTPKTIPLLFHKEQDNYSFMIGNVLDKTIPLHMNIHFSKDGIQVHNSIEEYHYTDYTSYEFDSKYLQVEREVSLNGKTAHYSKNHIEKNNMETPSIVFFDSIKTPMEWYSLPWNSYLGREDYLLSITEKDQLLSRRFVYYTPTIEKVFVREKDTKRYYSKTPSGVISDSILLDSIDKTILGIKDKDHCLLESHFLGSGVKGFYQAHLADQYFYHISRANHFEDVSKENSFFITRQDGVLKNVDLLDSKKYIKK